MSTLDNKEEVVSEENAIKKSKSGVIKLTIVLCIAFVIIGYQQYQIRSLQNTLDNIDTVSLERKLEVFEEMGKIHSRAISGLESDVSSLQYEVSDLSSELDDLNRKIAFSAMSY